VIYKEALPPSAVDPRHTSHSPAPRTRWFTTRSRRKVTTSLPEKSSFGKKGTFKRTKTKKYDPKEFIRKEVAKALRDGVGQSSQRLTLWAQFDAFPVFSDGQGSKMVYWRMPIAAVIPPRRGKNEEPDDRHPRKNEVYISGAFVRFTIDYAVTVSVIGIAYEDRV
jgi:hypothetical protein